MNKLTNIAIAVLTIILLNFGSVAIANAKTHNIDIVQFKFSAAELQVKVGDKITWTNKDGASHTATAIDKSWTTKTLKKGESETITVTANMTLDYFCNIHRNMKAKLKM